MMKFGISFLAALLLEVALSFPMNSDVSGNLRSDGSQAVNIRDQPIGIYGGHNITIKKANYIGAVLDNEDILRGSVVILDNRWVATNGYLTALFLPSDLKVRVGSTYVKEGGKVVNVTQIVRHPKFTAWSWDYDIALLKLETPLSFSATTHKVMIASSLPKNGTSTQVTGYGATTTSFGGYLQQANVPYMDSKDCAYYYQMTNVSLCTFKVHVSPCSYDYGSPLTYNGKLIGIFSGIWGCGSSRYPAVYADVTKFRGWIKETIKKNSKSVDELLENDYDTLE